MRYTKPDHFQRLPFVLLLLLCCIISGCTAQNQPRTRSLGGLGGLETGDFVFLDLDCGEICEAIETVTLQQFKVEGPRLSHMGVVEAVHDKTYIWEAWPEKGVQRVLLDEFLARVKGGEDQAGGYYIGRLKPNYRMQARKLVIRLKKYEGRPYDELFAWNSDKFYCSELIAHSFGPSYFKPVPMYFGEAGTPEFLIWEKYYSEKKRLVPVGKLGNSPLGIYLAGKERLFVQE